MKSLLLCAFFSVFTTNFLVYGRVLKPKIVGGENADLKSSKFVVALLASDPVLGIKQHGCGGSIITEHWVLTAAHCFDHAEASNMSMVLQAGTLHLKADGGFKQERAVGKYVVHPRYKNVEPAILDFPFPPHDIALAFTTEPFFWTEFVQPIRLPTTKNLVPSGVGRVFGWGDTSRDDTKVSPDILQTIELTILDLKGCEWILETKLESGIFCTAVDDSNSSVSPCVGDSGGPFIQMTSNGYPELIGIVSWGYTPCAYPGIPSGFVQVSSYIDWIWKTIETQFLNDR